jgi:hypothetical protein
VAVPRTLMFPQQMQLQTTPPEAIETVSKVKLALGAASLFLFIVGVKRSFHMDEGGVESAAADPGEPRPRRPRRKKRGAGGEQAADD